MITILVFLLDQIKEGAHFFAPPGVYIIFHFRMDAQSSDHFSEYTNLPIFKGGGGGWPRYPLSLRPGPYLCDSQLFSFAPFVFTYTTKNFGKLERVKAFKFSALGKTASCFI